MSAGPRHAFPRRPFLNPVLCYVRARLRRRLFVWFGATILLTGIAVSVVFGWNEGSSWHREYQRACAFVAGRFNRVWDEPVARDELARAISADLDTSVALQDADHNVLQTVGPTCAGRGLTTPVVRDGRTLGHVFVCADRFRRRPYGILLPLLVSGLMLWGAAGKIAGRLSRPLGDIAKVALDLGEGRMSTRVKLGRNYHGETAVVAHAINHMAARIEEHLTQQRELLAAVSHELRTPLARIRLLTELARTRLVPGTEGEAGAASVPPAADSGAAVSPTAVSPGADPAATVALLDDLDREVMEIDALVGDLLASSRIEFAVHAALPLDAAEAAARALARAGVDASLLVVEAGDTRVEADPTLLARALANLIDNANKHGGGLRVLRIKGTADALALEAEDAGAGFPPGEETRIFEPFYRRAAPGEDGGGNQGSLGLGLSLVKRIADAHRGRAYAENRPGGGARVGIELPLHAAPAPA